MPTHPVLCFDASRLDLRGLALRNKLRELGDADALTLLVSAGSLPATRGRKATAFLRFLQMRQLSPNPIHAALLVVLEDIRRGLAATTILGRMRTLEVSIWQHGIVELRREPEWLGARRAVSRALAAAPLPKEYLSWDEVLQRAHRLDPRRKIAAAVMLATGARYETVAAMRQGDILRVSQVAGPLWVVLRADKVRSPAFAFTYGVAPGSWAEGLLAPLAMTPGQLHARFARVDWVDRPRLLAFPGDWEAGGPWAKRAGTPLFAVWIRRAVIDRLLAAGTPQAQVAAWVGHSVLTNRGTYRDSAAPTPAEMEMAMRVAAN